MRKNYLIKAIKIADKIDDDGYPETLNERWEKQREKEERELEM